MWAEPKPSALLVLADGTVFEGAGFGATGHAAGEVCFNTAMTGYEEILTDPSYAGQIITFTFPHIGNVGTNEEDIETVNMAATPGARVSIPASPTMPRRFSQPSRCSLLRQFDGSVMAVRRITPRAPGVAAMFTVSMSSSFVPTLPMCGNVKVMICPAYEGSVRISS